MTGHRPEKIDDPAFVQASILYVLKEQLHPIKLIQGMAAGVDLWSAELALDHRIPLISARPWAGHKPRVVDRAIYNRALNEAHQVVNVSDREDYPGAWIYQKRNEWMVDNADVLLAVWDGSAGGTGNTVNYAIKQKVDIFRINPETKYVGWYKRYASPSV